MRLAIRLQRVEKKSEKSLIGGPKGVTPMILDKIILKNFRCFYGECTIDFSRDPEKNVTLIHAENGVGKTTLLNALLWCFYRKTTKRFEQREDILNHQAAKEGEDVACVRVQFEHNGADYEAARHFSKSDESVQNTLKVAKIDYGNHVPHTHVEPEAFINSVIPRDMAGHFLFDGEHAETISGEENRHEVGKAVRDILGCTLIQSAIDDLDYIHKEYRKNANSAVGSTNIQELEDKEKSFEQQIQTAKQKIEQAELELSSISQQQIDINKELRDSAAAKEIQRRKEELERHLKRAQNNANAARTKVLNWLGDNGRFLVASKITEETHDCLEDETTRGKIPAPYNKDFVSSVLRAEKCICGAPLTAGSPEAALVASLLDTASSKVLQDRIIKVRSRLESLSENRTKAPSRLNEARAQLADEEEEVTRLEVKLAECRNQIKNIDVDEIREKEIKLEELRNREREIDRDVVSLQMNITRCEREQRDISKQIDQITAKSREAKRFIARRDLARDLKERLENELKNDEDSAKAQIRTFIREIIDKTARKDFVVSMDKNFTIKLRNSDGMSMAKSEGENQLLGLAFIGALCKFAKLRKNASGEHLLPGTEAPLVLDSPFGKLDQIYKVATAEFIPEMASQVILMVSSEQGSANVMARLKDKIGAEFCLIRHNTGEQGDKESEHIDIGTKRISTTVYSSNFDGTVIEGVA
ncbi:AAA family ATPase [Kordiimonas sp.]|uniref:AAA family ATPase n=1 Tax=Kordiimonas sp. TaxID=1970157 RepID=UPI003A92E0F6